MKHKHVLLFLSLVLSACSGGVDSNINTEGIVITPGNEIAISLQGARELGLAEPYNIEFKQISNDFTSVKVIYSATEKLQSLTPDADGYYRFVLNKDIPKVRLMLITITSDISGVQLVDVLADPTDFTAKPDLTSTLAYDLIKNYPNKPLNQYSANEYESIKSLIQQNVDRQIQESENLSLTKIEYPRLTRYFKNGLAYNINFLTKIRDYGVVYCFDETTPQGITLSMLPTGDRLENYKIAQNLTISSNNKCNDPSLLTARVPYLHTNTLPVIDSNITYPMPSSSISVLEDRTVSLVAAMTDEDHDFIEKDFLIEYSPRSLPPSRLACQQQFESTGSAPPTCPATPYPTEKKPESFRITQLSIPEGVDFYETPEKISLSEALDTGAFPECANNTDCKTAYRYVYYLVTDGTIRIPIRWAFRYVNRSSKPQFLSREVMEPIPSSSLFYKKKKVTQDFLNSYLKTQPDGSVAPTHRSICDARSDDRSQAITSRVDNPWTCIVKAYDPDIDIDPLGSADELIFSANSIDPYTEVKLGSVDDLNHGVLNDANKIWPIVQQNQTTLLTGKSISDCSEYVLDASGATIEIPHRSCSYAIYQVTIDNAVKVSSEQKGDLKVFFNLQVQDRLDNPAVSTQYIERMVEFVPIPPRMVRYDQENKPASTPLLSTTFFDPPNQSSIRKPTRPDIYLSELLNEINNAVPGSTLSYSDIGLILATNAHSARTNIFSLTDANAQAQISSPYFTEPKLVQANTNLQSLTATSPTPLNSLLEIINQSGVIPYHAPEQYDGICTGAVQTSNNLNQPNGFVFELNAIDLDNIDLKPSEPTDPIYVMSLLNNYNMNADSKGVEYCSYTTPTSSLTFYQNYTNTTEMNSCPSWSSVPPLEMQPIPVFYTVTEGGQSKIKKSVYHRLWVRWRPRENGLPNLPDGLLKNQILKIALGGNLARYNNQADKIEIYSNTSSLTPNTTPETWKQNTDLLAARKEMKPCINGLAGSLNGVVHDEDPSLSSATLRVLDENKAGISLPATYVDKSWSISGREQLEVKVLGNRNILSNQFLKFTPFITSKIQLGTTDLRTSVPAIWFSNRNDSSHAPRTQIYSSINLDTTNTSTFASIGIQYKAPTLNGNPYYAAVVIKNTTAENPTLAQRYLDLTPQVNTVNNLCFPVKEILIEPFQEYVVIPTTCSADDLLNAASPRYVQSLTTPVLPVYYQLDFASAGFNLNTLIAQHNDINKFYNVSMRVLPDFYGAPFAKAALNINPINGLFFEVQPINTFIFNGKKDGYIYEPTLYANPHSNQLGQSFYQDSTTHQYVSLWNSPNPMPTPGEAYRNTNTLNPDGTWNPSIVGIKPAVTPAPLYDISLQGVDWDYQSNYVKLTAAATPDPNTSLIYYRLSPGNKVSLYIRTPSNDPTALPTKAIIPFSTSDTTGDENKDPFDVHVYGNALGAPILQGTNVPVNPVLLKDNAGTRGGGNCLSLPAGFPSTGLNVQTLENYRQCSIEWQPDKNDFKKGKIFYDIPIQDNPGATPTTPGFGGIYPTGVLDPYVFLSQNTPTNRSTAVTHINLQVELLETNTAPNFDVPATPTGLTTNTMSQAPAGLISSLGRWCSSPDENFPCANDLILGTGTSGNINDSAYFLLEGVTQNFSLRSVDSNSTTNLKKLTSNKPTQAVVLKGNSNESYSPPGWSSMVYSTTQNLNAGSLDIAFQWKPSDVESVRLSTPNGFLIPITVSDTDYNPEESDGSFPTQTEFYVKKKSTRMWIWTKASPKNNAPTITAARALPLPASAEFALPSKITLTAGQSYTYNIKITDIDTTSRMSSLLPADVPVITDTFLLSMENQPDWITLTQAPVANPAPVLNATNYIETHTLTFTPKNEDAGKLFTYNLIVRDPGDASRGIAEHPTLSPGTTDTCFGPSETCVNNYNPPRVFIGAGSSSNNIIIPLTISVVGKPLFQIPKTTLTQSVPAYLAKPFQFPVSVNITREEEKFKDFFIGIDVTDTRATPVAHASNPSYTPYKSEALYSGVYALPNGGFYVTQSQILKWDVPSTKTGTGVDVFPLGAAKNVKIYGIRTVSSGSPAVGCLNASLLSAPPKVITAGERWLVRYNTLSSKYEYCRISAYSNTNELSSATLEVRLVDSNVPDPVSITTTTLERSINYTGDPLSTTAKEFAEFKARCAYCSNSPVSTNNVNSIDNLTLNSSVPSQAQPVEVQYSQANITGQFRVTDQKISKSFIDTTPFNSPSLVPLRITSAMVKKNESLKFSATLATSTPESGETPYYRWYVNGCFKEGGLLPQNTNQVPAFTFKTPSLANGPNNDCSGQYSIDEPIADNIGLIIVRLTLSKGDEIFDTNPNYDHAPTSYIWRLSVINTDPVVLSDNPGSLTAGTPIILSTSNGWYNGNANSTFALPVSHNSKEYFAYTEEFTASPMRVVFRELGKNGNILNPNATPSMSLTCQEGSNSVKKQPAFLGIHSIDNKLYVSTTTNDGLGVVSSAINEPGKNQYTQTTQSCFTDSLVVGQNIFTNKQATLSASVVAQYLMYSNHTSSTLPKSVFKTSSNPFRHNTSDANNFYTLMGLSSAPRKFVGLSNFWGYDFKQESSSVFTPPATVPEEFSSYTSNQVRKIIPYQQDKFFVLLGSTANPNNSKGIVLNISTVPSGGAVTQNNVTGTIIATSRFSKASDALLPYRDQRDCNFYGTPIDGVYSPKNDTLFLHISSYEANNRGVFAAIRDASTLSPKCEVIATSSINPPLSSTTHNTAMNKMFFDSSRDFITGVVSTSSNLSQFFVIDAITSDVVTREITNIQASHLIYSQQNNSTYIFDNRRSPNFPTLYRVW